MKRLHILEPGRAEWADAPMPVPEKHEVLVKVHGITTCPHWDIHMMDGEPMLPGAPLKYPLTPGQPGHEMTGEVVEVGKDVTDLKVGDRVAAWQDRGARISQGCYAQYVPFAAASLLKVSNDLSPADIAPLELAMCVQVAFDQLAPFDVIKGKRFGVGGLGPAGLIAVQMARAYGAAEVIGIDPVEERRTMALESGAHRAISPDPDAYQAGRFSDTAMDAAIDATGLKPSIEYLIARSRKAVVIFGVLREDINFTADLWRGGFALLGYGAHNRTAGERALQLIESGHLTLAPLVTHTLPFTQYAEGVELLRTRQAVKILFDPWL